MVKLRVKMLKLKIYIYI